jgi:DNA invertase Pin-like site-specific DNA recombinase
MIGDHAIAMIADAYVKGIRGFDAEEAYRQNGKRLGRPATAVAHANEVRQLYRTGIAKAEIARALNIGRTSVRRILADAGIAYGRQHA